MSTRNDAKVTNETSRTIFCIREKSQGSFEIVPIPPNKTVDNVDVVILASDIASVDRNSQSLRVPSGVFGQPHAIIKEKNGQIVPEVHAGLGRIAGGIAYPERGKSYDGFVPLGDIIKNEPSWAEVLERHQKQFRSDVGDERNNGIRTAVEATRELIENNPALKAEIAAITNKSASISFVDIDTDSREIPNTPTRGGAKQAVQLG